MIIMMAANRMKPTAQLAVSRFARPAGDEYASSVMLSDPSSAVWPAGSACHRTTERTVPLGRARGHHPNRMRFGPRGGSSVPGDAPAWPPMGYWTPDGCSPQGLRPAAAGQGGGGPPGHGGLRGRRGG